MTDYEKGLKDAWECARSVACMPKKEKIKNFGTDDLTEILLLYTPEQNLRKNEKNKK